MPAKIAILIAQKLADERTRKIIITIVAVVLSIIFLLVAGLQAIIALFTITLSTFLTEDTSLVGQAVALMDEGVSLVFTHGHRAAHGHRHSANGHQVSDGRWEAPQSRFPCREAQSVHTRRNGRTGAPRGQS